MPKIKKTEKIDFSRKNPISLRIDPYLLSHFTEKADGAPGTRTKLMERSMRIAEEMEPIWDTVTKADPNTFHDATHWTADGSRMNVEDARILYFIKTAVTEKLERGCTRA